MLNAEIIRNNLSEKSKNLPIYIFDEIASTNLYCREADIFPPFAVFAEHQTHGRGRQGKSFYSPKGEGLYFSLAMPIKEASQLITLFCAVAVSKAIEKACSLYPKIKWVNDLYLDNKKICGILCERTDAGIIIGIGVNCTTSVFPEELNGIASSLKTEISRNILAAEILNNIFDYNADFLDDYRRRSYLTGKKICFIKNKTEYTATVLGVDDSGNLLIEYPNGQKDSLNSGEISIKK